MLDLSKFPHIRDYHDEVYFHQLDDDGDIANEDGELARFDTSKATLLYSRYQTIRAANKHMKHNDYLCFYDIYRTHAGRFVAVDRAVRYDLEAEGEAEGWEVSERWVLRKIYNDRDNATEAGLEVLRELTTLE